MGTFSPLACSTQHSARAFGAHLEQPRSCLRQLGRVSARTALPRAVFFAGRRPQLVALVGQAIRQGADLAEPRRAVDEAWIRGIAGPTLHVAGSAETQG